MPLDKASLGTRYVCFSCAAKFYDLNREEPTCPACGTDQRDNPNPDPRAALMSSFGKRRRKKKAAPAETTAAETTKTETTKAETTKAETTSDDAMAAMSVDIPDDDDDDDADAAKADDKKKTKKK